MTSMIQKLKDQDDRVDIATLTKILRESKVNGGRESIWTAAMNTFSMADGKSEKSDVKVACMEQALELVTNYTEHAVNPRAWDLVPLELSKAKREDFYLAFLHWAKKDDGTNDGTINVSKAIRRMEAYLDWMKDNRKDLEEPLTVESIAEAAHCWDIQVTHDTQGQLLWWVDLGSMDKAKIKKIDNRDHLRYVVWFAHRIMFDKSARENGAPMIENMGHTGFWKIATLFPHDLSTKMMDRLTVGILPVKMKAFYVFGAATWMHLIMTLLKPFMGKKMRERMVLLPDNTDMQKFCDDLVGRKNIPQGFCGIQGEAPRDALLIHFKNGNESSL